MFERINKKPEINWCQKLTWIAYKSSLWQEIDAILAVSSVAPKGKRMEWRRENGNRPDNSGKKNEALGYRMLNLWENAVCCMLFYKH